MVFVLCALERSTYLRMGLCIRGVVCGRRLGVLGDVSVTCCVREMCVAVCWCAGISKGFEGLCLWVLYGFWHELLRMCVICVILVCGYGFGYFYGIGVDSPGRDHMWWGRWVAHRLGKGMYVLRG